MGAMSLKILPRVRAISDCGIEIELFFNGKFARANGIVYAFDGWGLPFPSPKDVIIKFLEAQ